MENPPPEGAQTEPEMLLPLPEWLIELNQQLASAAASAAEQAFGMGCTVSLAPIAIVLALAFLLGARHWVSLLLVGTAALLLALAWSVFVALQAHRKGPRRAWQERLRLDIEAGLAARGQSRAQLIQEAQQLLPESAPLRQALRGDFE